MLRKVWLKVWPVIVQTFAGCIRYRVTGLGAEAAFFAILSLPPLIFGLAGAIGFVAQTLRRDHRRRVPRPGARPVRRGC